MVTSGCHQVWGLLKTQSHWIIVPFIIPTDIGSTMVPESGLFFWEILGRTHIPLFPCSFNTSLKIACIYIYTPTHTHFPGSASGNEPVHQCSRHKRCSFDPWVRKIPWRRKWQCTPVFLPGESYGQRNLVVYCPYCCKESGTIEMT